MPPSSPPQPTFTQALVELETIVSRFRQEDLPLEEAIQLFETGIARVEQCQRTLDTARGKVEVLVSHLQSHTDTPATEPFEE